MQNFVGKSLTITEILERLSRLSFNFTHTVYIYVLSCVFQVTKFKYLGAWITEDGRSDLEVRTRIAMAKESFSKRRELLTKGLNVDTKKKIIKTLVWSVALYGCETLK